jgi:4-amino-4-deoxychorismate lyase
MSRFIESIRWEFGQYHLLDYHSKRMERTMREVFGVNQKIDLSRILKRPSGIEPLQKCRIIYDRELRKIEWLPYSRKLTSLHQFVIDNSIRYKYKFEKRDHLNALKNQMSAQGDIIIVKNNFITDAYYSNLVFFDGEQWVTPENPLLEGVMRGFLIDQKIIRTGHISLDDLTSFQVFKKINALNPFDDAPLYFVNQVSPV